MFSLSVFTQSFWYHSNYWILFGMFQCIHCQFTWFFWSILQLDVLLLTLSSHPPDINRSITRYRVQLFQNVLRCSPTVFTQSFQFFFALGLTPLKYSPNIIQSFNRHRVLCSSVRCPVYTARKPPLQRTCFLPLGLFAVTIFWPFLISFLVHFQSYGSKNENEIENESKMRWKMVTVNDPIVVFHPYKCQWIWNSALINFSYFNFDPSLTFR